MLLKLCPCSVFLESLKVSIRHEAHPFDMKCLRLNTWHPMLLSSSLSFSVKSILFHADPSQNFLRTLGSGLLVRLGPCNLYEATPAGLSFGRRNGGGVKSLTHTSAARCSNPPSFCGETLRLCCSFESKPHWIRWAWQWFSRRNFMIFNKPAYCMNHRSSYMLAKPFLFTKNY